ncbi:PAS domain S-box protein [Nitratidesulfovibrio sp. SRB-5]|uniref:PAS domain S-box protein n=1 Tax=Nitratidesulfovibrio sp. SRB-5 TaxID=2872636 RepID=UPI00167EFDD5|nr:PAS domain S-box protein [Nitratidesulfovibrio sp. SRB-5]MBZ2173017.1 PAS domain S-box protein [Nitratidesulfovibrio sp. SRB-5]
MATPAQIATIWGQYPLPAQEWFQANMFPLGIALASGCMALAAIIALFALRRHYKKRLAAMSDELRSSLELRHDLAKRNAGLRTILDHTNTIFFILDRDGTVALSEGMGLNLIKRPAGGSVGMKFGDLHPDRADLQQLFELGMQGQTLQAHVPFSGGTFQLLTSPLTDSQGEPNGLAGILLDVTELVQARERITESEAMFRSLFDNAPYSMLVQRISDGTCLEANRAFLESSGISRDELPRFDIAAVLDMSPDEARTMRHRVAAQGGVSGQEATVRRRDGSPAHVHYSTLPIIYSGEPSLLSMTVDITEQKNATRALMESEKRLSAIFNNAPLGLFLSTFSGRIEEVNPELVRMLGYESREEFLAAPPHSLYADPRQRDQVLQQLLVSPSGVSRELLLRRKDGELVPAVIRASLQFDAEGRPTRVHGAVENLSERKKHERELQFWTQRFETVITAAQHIFYDYDLRAGTIQWAGAMREVLGFELQEVDGPLQAWAALLAPEEAPRVLRKLDEACARGEKFDMEYRLRHKDGHYIYVHDCGFFQLDRDGRPFQMLGIIQNVSTRKQAEAALAASEERYRTLFESAQDTILVMDGPTIVDCNPGATVLTGCPREEIIGRTPADFSPPVQANGEGTTSMMMATLAEAANGKLLRFEWLCRRVGGDIVQVETSLAPMRLGDNSYLLAFTRDISERKKAENDLRLSEEKFSKIFNLAPYSISIARLSDSIILDVNDAFEPLTGYSRAEAVGSNGDNLGLWQDPESRKDFLEKLQQHGTVADYEFMLRRKDGTIRNALNSCQEIEINGERCSLNIVQDITEAKLVQKAMVETEKMMSLGGLAAGMAHEINNPLGIIFQSVQGVQRRFDPKLSANAADAGALDIDLETVQEYMRRRNISRYLNAIVEAGQRAADIVRHMLNFSRRNDAGLEDQDVAELVRRAVSLAEKDYDLKKMYDFRRISVRLELSDTLLSVPCISSEIEQVLLNLLRNAAQAMAGAGTPDPAITVRTTRENDEARIEVEDNGPGISADQLNRVFEPFYTTKKVGEGTGLGLSVSYFIITNTHQGKMSVESTPGQGALFTIRLPLKRATNTSTH